MNIIIINLSNNYMIIIVFIIVLYTDNAHNVGL